MELAEALVGTFIGTIAADFDCFAILPLVAHSGFYKLSVPVKYGMAAIAGLTNILSSLESS